MNKTSLKKEELIKGLIFLRRQAGYEPNAWYEIQEKTLLSFALDSLEETVRKDTLDEVFRKLDDPNFKPTPNTKDFAIRNAMFSRFVEILEVLKFGGDDKNE